MQACVHANADHLFALARRNAVSHSQKTENNHEDQSSAEFLSAWTYLVNISVHDFYIQRCIKTLIYRQLFVPPSKKKEKEKTVKKENARGERNEFVSIHIVFKYFYVFLE